LDADMNYELDVGVIEEKKVGEKRSYTYLEPVQGPINAPYHGVKEKKLDDQKS